MSDDPCCANCPYWERLEEDDGFCLRYPPMLLVRTDPNGNQSGYDATHPITGRDDICGEHPDHPARQRVVPVIPATA